MRKKQIELADDWHKLAETRRVWPSVRPSAVLTTVSGGLRIGGLTKVRSVAWLRNWPSCSRRFRPGAVCGDRHRTAQDRTAWAARSRGGGQRDGKLILAGGLQGKPSPVRPPPPARRRRGFPRPQRRRSKCVHVADGKLGVSSGNDNTYACGICIRAGTAPPRRPQRPAYSVPVLPNARGVTGDSTGGFASTTRPPAPAQNPGRP